MTDPLGELLAVRAAPRETSPPAEGHITPHAAEYLESVLSALLWLTEALHDLYEYLGIRRPL